MTKKLLIAGVLMLGASAIALYRFGPFARMTGLSRHIDASQAKVARFMNGDSLAQRILQGVARKTDSGFVIGHTEFIAGKHYMNGLAFAVKNGQDRFETQLLGFPDGPEKTQLNWTFGAAGGKTATLSRARRQQIRGNMEEMLLTFGRFVSDPDSIYGFHIDRTATSGDTVVLTTRRNFTENPGTEEIYRLLDSVRWFAGNEAIARDAIPMMNISQDSGRFRLMVAWPVGRMGTNGAGMSYKRMIQHLFLRTEVTGGNNRVDAGIHAMDLYMTENKLNPVALPFAYLLTDRRSETDSSKWKTIIYYPCY